MGILIANLFHYSNLIQELHQSVAIHTRCIDLIVFVKKNQQHESCAWKVCSWSTRKLLSSSTNHQDSVHIFPEDKFGNGSSWQHSPQTNSAQAKMILSGNQEISCRVLSGFSMCWLCWTWLSLAIAALKPFQVGIVCTFQLARCF